MSQTILLLVLVVALILFLSFVFIKDTKLSKKANLFWIAGFITSILLLFLFTGTAKIKSDVSKMIHNSLPKNPTTVYGVLFGKPQDNCVSVINLKDQVIPAIDCCIWMELQMCPAELKRILALRNYTMASVNTSDSLNYLNPFKDRPSWWTPELLGDRLIKYQVVFNESKQQTLFINLDSTHLYLCDRAQ